MFLANLKNYSFKEILSWAFTDSEMRKRILIAFGFCILIKILYMLPIYIPGLNMKFIASINKLGVEEHGLIWGKDRWNIFQLGIIPFINACILLQIGSIFIPSLKKMLFGDENSMIKLNKLTYIVAIISALIQGIGLGILYTKYPMPQGYGSIVTFPSIIFLITTTLTLTAGTIILLIIMNLITKHGIGNGIQIIFLVGFVDHIVFSIKKYYSSGITQESFNILIAIYILIFITCYYFASKTKILNVYCENNKSEIPFKPNIIGTIPISLGVFFATLLYIPAGNYFPQFKTTIYFISIAVLAFLFVFLYAQIIYDRDKIENMTNKYGFYIDGGKKKIDDVMSKTLMISAGLLIAIYLIPSLLNKIIFINMQQKMLIDGLSILIAMAAIIDIGEQINTYKNMATSNIKKWVICNRTLDEVEAKLQSLYLTKNGIQNFVESLRYSWGLPIRNAVEQYLIYVPEEQNENVNKLLAEVKK